MCNRKIINTRVKCNTCYAVVRSARLSASDLQPLFSFTLTRQCTLPTRIPMEAMIHIRKTTPYTKVNASVYSRVSR